MSQDEVRAYMEAKAANIDSESSDDEEMEAALELARRERVERKSQEAKDGRVVAGLMSRAEASLNDGQHMEAVLRFTEALAIEPNNANILAVRAAVCARLDRHQACLHDGELIVKIMPDWYQGHAICGSALFCLKQYVASARAYTTAVSFASASPVVATAAVEWSRREPWGAHPLS